MSLNTIKSGTATNGRRAIIAHDTRGDAPDTFSVWVQVSNYSQGRNVVSWKNRVNNKSMAECEADFEKACKPSIIKTWMVSVVNVETGTREDFNRVDAKTADEACQKELKRALTGWSKYDASTVEARNITGR